MATPVEEIQADRVGQQTQDCPNCGGIMPAEAIHYGPWRLVTTGVRPYYQRQVSMVCPHCEHSRARSQRLPVRQ